MKGHLMSTVNVVKRFSVGGVHFTTPAMGMEITTPDGDWGMVFEVRPHICKDGREVFRCRIAKSHRHESRWVTVSLLRSHGSHYVAV